MPELVVDQVLTGADLGFNWGLSDLLFAEVGGRSVLYALSRADGALTELSVASDGSLSVATTLSLSGAFEVGSSPALGFVDGALVLAGMTASYGQFVAIDANGTLGAQFAEAGVGTLSAPVSVDGILVAGRSGASGLDAFSESDGGLAWSDGLDDTGSTYLADVAELVSFSSSGVEYVASVSATENGVTLVSVASNGTLLVADAFGTLDGLPVGGPAEIEAIQRMGETYLIVGAAGSSSISTLKISDGGEIWLADHVLDSTETLFQGVSAMDAVTVGDFAYVAAGGADGGVSLFTMLPGGRMVHLTTIADDATTTLYRVLALSMTATNGALQIFAGSAWEAGLTRLSFDVSTLGAVLMSSGAALSGTPQNDQLIGGDMADDLSGGAGDDILIDGNGSDVMAGGSGADLFVFAADGLEDTVVDYTAGTDRLDLSSFDFLYDVSQLTITSTSDGAILSFGDEVVRLYSDDGGTLEAGDFTNAEVLNVDRPPLLAVHQNLVGGPGADVLNGNSGNDTISGFGGDDVLSGGGGQDVIYGGDGSDTLEGSDGNDSLEGNAGLDVINGGLGDDFVDGGPGGDLIYGDDVA